MSKRRKFTKEFKQEAVGLVEEPGVSCAQIARDLGINANMLSRWRRELAVDDRRAFRGHGQSRDEDLTAVRRELARVKKERDFLREAAVFFAKASK
jgi:transposase